MLGDQEMMREITQEMKRELFVDSMHNQVMCSLQERDSFCSDAERNH